MNIFALDINPKRAAEYHNNKHVVKMIVETAQILSINYHILGEYKQWMYKPVKSWFNHPSVVWARESQANMRWTTHLGYCLLKEYSHRYSKIHACDGLFHSLTSHLSVVSGLLKNEQLTPFKLAMQEMHDEGLDYNPTMQELQFIDTKAMQEYIGVVDNEFIKSIVMYRRYYNEKKQHLASWKNRPTPEWFNHK